MSPACTELAGTRTGCHACVSSGGCNGGTPPAAAASGSVSLGSALCKSCAAPRAPSTAHRGCSEVHTTCSILLPFTLQLLPLSTVKADRSKMYCEGPVGHIAPGSDFRPSSVATCQEGNTEDGKQALSRIVMAGRLIPFRDRLGYHHCPTQTLPKSHTLNS